MSLALPRLDSAWNLEEVREILGGIPLSRIRFQPRPGAAREEDVLLAERPCELVDGVLVEKPVGYYESAVTMLLGELLTTFVRREALGLILAPDAPVRLFAGRVRMPDLSFVSWRHFPGGRLPRGGILGVAPDLAVEILSPGNTPAEMTLKREEYFAAGCRLIWEVDPDSRCVRVYTSPGDFTLVGPDGTLDGADVLPGFEAPLHGIFPPREAS